MAKLPNRLVTEIANTDKVDELGNPVIGFESKDYAECIIEELEKIKDEIGNEFVDLQDGSEEWRSYVNDAVLDCYEIIEKHISELKGENK